MRNLMTGFVLLSSAVVLASCGGISIEDKRPVHVVACQAFDPLYFRDEVIAVMSRDEKTAVAVHNQTWERLCNKRGGVPTS